MNSLQFDMLKRMMNLEKKLNRAMRIDLAAVKSNKPELHHHGGAIALNKQTSKNQTS
jgi:hypothetical protein